MAPQDGLTAILTRAETTAPTLQWSAPLLRVDGLSVSYGPNQVVTDVGFELGRGQSLALIGESGSGKSTIARAVLRLLPSGGHATGRIEFDGQEVLGLSERRFRPLRGRAIGFVPQDPGNALNPVRTIGAQAKEAAALLDSASNSSWRRSPRSGSTTPSVSMTRILTSCPAACCNGC
jgi:peptide/nickel transport system ATP-binding protein